MKKIIFVLIEKPAEVTTTLFTIKSQPTQTLNRSVNNKNSVKSAYLCKWFTLLNGEVQLHKGNLQFMPKCIQAKWINSNKDNESKY